MSAQHTPGPWQVRTLENFGFNVVHYVGGDKFNIARVAKAGNEADASLIAAAPDLLEALKGAIGALEQDVDTGADYNDADWTGIANQRLAAARAAIAKATGDHP